MEGSLVAYKVFTNGSTLQASELNENLMQQSTAVFSNAAARTAAITSPVEGQLTYLEDTNQYASWNGSAWVSPFGMTLLVSQSFTAQASVAVDNVFTSDYDDYRVVYEYRNTTIESASVQLRASGSTIAGSNYKFQRLRVTGSTVSGAGSTGTDSWPPAATNSVGDTTVWALNIYNPARAVETSMDSQGWNSGASQYGFTTWGYQNDELVRDGIVITIGSGTMTGSVKIYGMRK
jgi:hypothetical protein